ncbi:MAG: hypothetical protein AAFV25_23120 [Bacteroidota bacterium]
MATSCQKIQHELEPAVEQRSLTETDKINFSIGPISQCFDETEAFIGLAAQNTSTSSVPSPAPFTDRTGTLDNPICALPYVPSCTSVVDVHFGFASPAPYTISPCDILCETGAMVTSAMQETAYRRAIRLARDNRPTCPTTNEPMGIAALDFYIRLTSLTARTYGLEVSVRYSCCDDVTPF